MINKYFRYALFVDYTIAAVICVALYFCQLKGYTVMPKAENSFTITTDLCSIALTLAGFVLTLLTVLITFKAAAKIPQGNRNDDIPLFDLFFATGVYNQTTSLLKGAIKSLLFVALVGFSLKILLPERCLKFLFYSNVIGLIIIGLTLWRCLLILGHIIALQRESSQRRED